MWSRRPPRSQFATEATTVLLENQCRDLSIPATSIKKAFECSTCAKDEVHWPLHLVIQSKHSDQQLHMEGNHLVMKLTCIQPHCPWPQDSRTRCVDTSAGNSSLMKGEGWLAKSRQMVWPKNSLYPKSPWFSEGMSNGCTPRSNPNGGMRLPQARIISENVVPPLKDNEVTQAGISLGSDVNNEIHFGQEGRWRA